MYSWCPIKYNINKTKKNNKNENDNDKNKNDHENENDEDQDNNLLKAANNTEDIKIGKWYNGKLLINKLTNKKYNKGYCNPPLKTQKINNKVSNNKKNVDGDKMILTLENYKPGNCNINLTPSKGGYNRDQLYDFGVNYLKIPHTQLRKDKKIDGIKLQKDVLCKIINNKYREIQKSYGIGSSDDNIILNAYEKDIEQCINGESKGGYSWPKLKDIAITYYGLTEDEIKEKDYKKEDLCKYISKIINKKEQNLEKQDLENPARKTDFKNNSNNENNENNENSKDEDNDNSDKDYTMKYNGDIKLCNETPKRGGLSLSKVKKIAEKNFNIDIQNKNKKELCSLIEDKLQKHFKPIHKSTSEKNNDNNKDNEDEFNDEELDDDDEFEEEEEDEEKYKESKL